MPSKVSRANRLIREKSGARNSAFYLFSKDFLQAANFFTQFLERCAIRHNFDYWSVMKLGEMIERVEKLNHAVFQVNQLNRGCGDVKFRLLLKRVILTTEYSGTHQSHGLPQKMKALKLSC